MNSLTVVEIVSKEVSASSAETKRSTRTQFQLLSFESTRPSIAGTERPPGKESGTTRSLKKNRKILSAESQERSTRKGIPTLRFQESSLVEKRSRTTTKGP